VPLREVQRSRSSCRAPLAHIGVPLAHPGGLAAAVADRVSLRPHGETRLACATLARLRADLERGQAPRLAHGRWHTGRSRERLHIGVRPERPSIRTSRTGRTTQRHRGIAPWCRMRRGSQRRQDQGT
jgi:hypothetical protein